MDNQQVQNHLKRLENSLRQLQLASSERFNEIYNDVCETLFDGDFYQEIWDEPVLLQIVRTFNENPPATRFTQKIESIKERAAKVCLVNDLFSSVLDFGAPEENVVIKLQKLLAINGSILPRMQAENKLNNIRSGDAPPYEKLKAFLSHFSEDLSVDFGAWGECIQNCLNALNARQEIGRADALLVNPRANKASVIPIRIIVQSGNGQLTHLVPGKEDFKLAVERARQCLLGDGFIRPTDNVLYTLDVTEAEYSGDSIGLPAAIAMFSAAKGIEIDPYTAFTGNINFSDKQWVINGVSGISHKLRAARDCGCRRVFIPRQNEHDVRPEDTEGLNIILTSNIMEVLLKLQTPPERLQGDSLHVRKINSVRAFCQGEGWQLSDPIPIQGGLQFIISPPTPPDLKLNIYNTGAHSPKKHDNEGFQRLMNDLGKLEVSAVPIQKVQQVFQIQDPTLRMQIKQEFDKMKPTSSRQEQYCEYSYYFDDGKEKLVIKQYTSGKLQLQGMAGDLYRRALDVIVPLYNLKYPQAKLAATDYLQMKTISATSVQSEAVKQIADVPPPYIGTDEAGKGDYFGPLIIAGVWADKKLLHELELLGVKDSKLLSDKRCRELAAHIRSLCKGNYQEVEIPPERYNELYEQFKAEKKNLNHLLAWGHARAIESLLERLSCGYAVADQFGDEHYIESRLMQRGKSLKLIQLPKGTRYVAVAAASILARDCFVCKLDQISHDLGFELPKGASDAVIIAAKDIVNRSGLAGLRKVAKLHFKTTSLVLN